MTPGGPIRGALNPIRKGNDRNGRVEERAGTACQEASPTNLYGNSTRLNLFSPTSQLRQRLQTKTAEEYHIGSRTTTAQGAPVSGGGFKNE